MYSGKIAVPPGGGGLSTGCSRSASPKKKREYLGKCDNLNFKEKSPISSNNGEKPC
jgi:hypothetical protein